MNELKIKGIHNMEADLAELQVGIFTCKMILNDENIIIKRVIISK
jgi:hypothetical protein